MITVTDLKKKKVFPLILINSGVLGIVKKNKPGK